MSLGQTLQVHKVAHTKIKKRCVWSGMKESKSIQKITYLDNVHSQNASIVVGNIDLECKTWHRRCMSLRGAITNVHARVVQ